MKITQKSASGQSPMVTSFLNKKYDLAAKLLPLAFALFKNFLAIETLLEKLFVLKICHLKSLLLFLKWDDLLMAAI